MSFDTSIKRKVGLYMKKILSLLLTLILVLSFNDAVYADIYELYQYGTFKYNDVSESVKERIQTEFSDNISEEFSEFSLSNSKEWINVYNKEEIRYAYLIPLYKQGEISGFSIISDINYSTLITSSGIKSVEFMLKAKEALMKIGNNSKLIYEFPEGYYIKSDKNLIQMIDGKMYDVESIFDNNIDEVSFLYSTRNNISRYDDIKGALKYWDEFIPIYSNAVKFYGGYQNWLTNEGVSQYYADRSCGVTAAANVMCYLAKNAGVRYYNLYPYSSVSKNDFSKFQKSIYNYLEPAWYGIPGVDTMISRVKSYANSRGVELTEALSSDIWTEHNVSKYIEHALNTEKPVLLITWLSIIPDLKFHWVTVTKIYGSSHNIKILTSNWGEKKEYNFSLWAGSPSIYKGALYFR